MKRRFLVFAMLVGMLSAQSNQNNFPGPSGAAGNISGLAGTSPGVPVIGGASGAVSETSELFVDVFTGADMCLQGNSAATTALGSQNSVLLNFKGFHGTKVCTGDHAAQMTKPLRNGSNFGGKLVFGDLRLYIDGTNNCTQPCTINNFADGFGSNQGTPAIIIPNGVTIDGDYNNRATAAGTGGGTGGFVIGVCSGTVAGCPALNAAQNPWPVRVYAITSGAFVNAGGLGSSSLTTICQPNGASPTTYCGLVLHTATTFTIGGNGADTCVNCVYVKSTGGNGNGEAVSIIAYSSIAPLTVNQAAPAVDAGTYETSVLCTGVGTGVPSGREAALCSDATSIIVRVPAGTVACNVTNCGYLSFYTPVIATGPGGLNSITLKYAVANTSAFGQGLKHVTLDLQGLPQVEAIRNNFGQENGRIENLNLWTLAGIGYENGTSNNQNYGPISGMEAYGGTVNTGCGPHTVAIFDHAADNQRRIEALTLSENVANCESNPATAAPYAISSISEATNTVTVNTTPVTTCATGNYAVIGGVGPVGFDGIYGPITVNTTQQFTYQDQAGLGTGAANFGQTMSATCFNANAARFAIMMDGNNVVFFDVHCESFLGCWEGGANEPIGNSMVVNLNGQPAPSSGFGGALVAMIQNVFKPFDYRFDNININAAAGLYLDLFQNQYSVDTKVETIITDCNNAASICNFFTTSPTMQSSFATSFAFGGHINQTAQGKWSGTCTMNGTTGCATQTFPVSFVSAPNCFGSWTGAGTLTGLLKFPSLAASVTPASSVLGDTAVVNWACVGAPN